MVRSLLVKQLGLVGDSLVSRQQIKYNVDLAIINQVYYCIIPYLGWLKMAGWRLGLLLLIPHHTEFVLMYLLMNQQAIHHEHHELTLKFWIHALVPRESAIEEPERVHPLTV